VATSNVLALIIDPNTNTTIYVGTAGEGLFILTDRGGSGNGEGSGGGCFIATAAYDSSVKPQGKFLRKLHDQFLFKDSTIAVFILLATLMTVSIALLYLWRRLQRCGVVFLKLEESRGKELAYIHPHPNPPPSRGRERGKV
jgi:hypothetical protein